MPFKLVSFLAPTGNDSNLSRPKKSCTRHFLFLTFTVDFSVFLSLSGRLQALATFCTSEAILVPRLGGGRESLNVISFKSSPIIQNISSLPFIKACKISSVFCHHRSISKCHHYRENYTSECSPMQIFLPLGNTLPAPCLMTSPIINQAL